MIDPVRFKITCDNALPGGNARIFYVYAPDANTAMQRFYSGRPELALLLVSTEEDREEWKTSMIENWRHGRPA